MEWLKLAWRFRYALKDILHLMILYINAKRDGVVTDDEWKEITDRLRTLLDKTNI